MPTNLDPQTCPIEEGRVGRSITKAYCYLFAPLSVLTDDARRESKPEEFFLIWKWLYRKRIWISEVRAITRRKPKWIHLRYWL
ncbi:MAG: hypothetical protein IPL23_06020 [Saprospiraceae bacterium]|nr:hypothetical protein [Saprospiraceae bacterium]